MAKQLAFSVRPWDDSNTRITFELQKRKESEWRKIFCLPCGSGEYAWVCTRRGWSPLGCAETPIEAVRLAIWEWGYDACRELRGNWKEGIRINISEKKSEQLVFSVYRYDPYYDENNDSDERITFKLHKLSATKFIWICPEAPSILSTVMGVSKTPAKAIQAAKFHFSHRPLDLRGNWKPGDWWTN